MSRPDGERFVWSPDQVQVIRPDLEQLQEWMSEGGCEALDGCWVEPDGTCEHGK